MKINASAYLNISCITMQCILFYCEGGNDKENSSIFDFDTDEAEPNKEESYFY